jgi:hypothetical protein
MYQKRFQATSRGREAGVLSYGTKVPCSSPPIGITVHLPLDPVSNPAVYCSARSEAKCRVFALGPRRRQSEGWKGSQFFLP